MSRFLVPTSENGGMGALLSRVVDTRWAVKPDVLHNLCAVVARHDAGAAITPEAVLAFMHPAQRALAEKKALRTPGEGNAAEAPLYEMVGSVAVISVGGLIVKFSSMVNGQSQPPGTSVERIGKALLAAREDRAASSILLLADSPGGSIAGVQDLAQLVRQTDEAFKPVEAYGQDNNHSASYWITRAARKLWGNAGGLTGSIGVYTVVADTSRAYANKGVTLALVSSGGVKGALAEGVPVTGEAVADVQREVNDLFGLFVADVARYGRLSMDRALQLADGRSHTGAQAHALGLIDGTPTLGEVLDRMHTEHGGSGGVARARIARADGPRGGAYGGGPPITREVRMSAQDLAAAAGTPAAHNGTPPAASNIPILAGTVAGAGGSDGSGASGAATLTLVNGEEIAREAGEKGAKAEARRQKEIAAAAAPFGHLPSVAKLLEAAQGDTTMGVERFKAQMLDAIAADKKPAGLTPGMGAVQTGFGGVSGGGSGGFRGSIEVGDSSWGKIAAAAATMIVLNITPEAKAAIDGVGVGAEKGERVAHILGYGGLADVRREISTARSARVNFNSAQTLARLYCEAMGERAPHHPDDLFKAAFGMDRRYLGAHGTSDFPLLLSNAMNKSLQASFALAETVWRRVCRVRPANDYKSADVLTKSEGLRLKLRREGAPAERMTWGERRESVRVEAYSGELEFTYQFFRNDDLGVLNEMLGDVRREQDRLPDDLFFDLLAANAYAGPTLLSDATTLFHASRGNLLAGAALSGTSLSAAETAFARRVGFNPQAGTSAENAARVVNVRPRLLLVATEGKNGALTLMQSSALVGANNSTVNIYQGRYEVLASPKIPAAQALRWWLLSDPSELALMEARFLDGNETAEITELPGKSDPMKMVFQANLRGFGLAAVNHEAGVMNPGS